MAVFNYDIVIAGGGMGGLAAALAACESGFSVVLTEPTDWLGGQMTAQGVSALDEHDRIEDIPPTRTYADLRRRIRAWYQRHYNLSDQAAHNPGNGWVSRLCFEPRVGVQVLHEMLAPHIATGRLQLMFEHEPVAARVEGGRVISLDVRFPASGYVTTLAAHQFLDATDLGDVLPLTGTDYVTGAEARADTDEPHAHPGGAKPHETQGFTFCFAVEHREGEDHTIEKPADYERMRDAQPYSLELSDHAGQKRRYFMWRTNPAHGAQSFWTYRRLVDAELLNPDGELNLRDIALINWPGNDFHRADLIHAAPNERARILNEAKQLSLGFLYWLQTEAPHDDDDGRGYPGLKLLPEVMGTADGLSKQPYIRESRRIVPLKRVVEQQISAEAGNPVTLFDDSIGIGWYAIDIHACVGNPATAYAPTHPFQIPLGALIPADTRNLIAASKNIGATHLTNGALRVHAVEWAIGEAAGTLAAYCCDQRIDAREVYESPEHMAQLRTELHLRGVRTAWPE